MSRRSLVVVGMLVALTLAGIVSYFASGSPDGLNKVASDTGFDKNAKEHDLEGSPFGGYETKGVGDGFLSGGVAGVAGVGVTFLIVGGVVWAVRRRSSPLAADDVEAHDAPTGPTTEGDAAEEPVRR
jgi:cobalt/nickel transport protein